MLIYSLKKGLKSLSLLKIQSKPFYFALEKAIKLPNLLRKDKGVAVVEMLPLLVIFVLFVGFTIGFWKAIHFGTLESIAARNYAFEVLNNRTHFEYHRDTIQPADYYGQDGYRFFAIVDFQNTEKPDLISISQRFNLFGGGITQVENISDDEKVSPMQLKIGYGICLDFACGGKKRAP